jgi:hypothetical protein
MCRKQVLFLAGRTILVAVGNVLQWRSRYKPVAEEEVIGRFAEIRRDRPAQRGSP